MARKRAPASRAALVFKGRIFSAADLALIRKLASRLRDSSRQKLAESVCERLSWRRPNGRLKWRECRDLLEHLAGAGELELPALRRTKPVGSKTRVPHTERGEPQPAIEGTVRALSPLSLQLVETQDARLLWRELVGRYHYLGHKVPFGAHLRYLIEVGGAATPRVAGCLQVSSPGWKMAPRDAWIGWSHEQRQRNLQRIVNNSRFLLLPWVQVPNLASAVLGQMARQVPPDWERAYGLRPVLFETLVDVKRFRGTCYRAANWIALGETTGRGRMDRFTQRKGAAVKAIFLFPLHRHARRLLLAGS